MYGIEISPILDKILEKVTKKDYQLILLLQKKTDFICNNPNHKYKWLRKPLNNFQRVHIKNNFVLIFTINHEKRKIYLHYFAHHDQAYLWKPKNTKSEPT